ncbi:hypothetical protein [Streptomyces sp. NPDC057702]|uniref:hypothetical protein n=1 Tax=unclassified Streptomyces TaxID=2593676 RepID=UPI0036CF26B0
MPYRPNAVDRAAAFVHAAGRAPNASVSHQLQALFGLSLAEKAGTPAAVTHTESMAVDIGERLDEVDAGGEFDPFAHDAKLLLLCHDTMRRKGVECRTLRTFVREVSAALRDMEAVPARLSGLARLLDAVGEGPFAAVEDVDDPHPSGVSLLLADPPVVRRLCDTIAGATLFGARAMPGHTAGLHRTLPVLTLQKLREYDLVLGSTLLRTLTYIDADDPEARACATRYLESQQRDDGRFGYYARELAEGPALRAVDQDLYLPVAVSVLWALAQVSVPGLRVVERVDR